MAELQAAAAALRGTLEALERRLTKARAAIEGAVDTTTVSLILVTWCPAFHIIYASTQETQEHAEKRLCEAEAARGGCGAAQQAGTSAERALAQAVK